MAGIVPAIRAVPRTDGLKYSAVCEFTFDIKDELYNRRTAWLAGTSPAMTGGRRSPYSTRNRENRKLQWLAPPANVCVRSK